MKHTVTIEVDARLVGRLKTYESGLRHGRRLGGEHAAAVDDLAMQILESIAGTGFIQSASATIPRPARAGALVAGAGGSPNGPAPAVHCAKGKSAARLAGTAAGDFSQLPLFGGRP